MKKILYFIIIAGLAVLAIVLLTSKKEPAPSKITTIESDTVLEGTQVIERGEKMVVKNGARLTVSGDLTIKGTLECQNGPLNVAVEGSLIVDKNIVCNLGESGSGVGINIAVDNSAIFNETAMVVSNSHVQITDDPAKLAQTSAELEKIFDDVESDRGSNLRIGPFLTSNQEAGDLPTMSSVPKIIHSSKGLVALAPTAHAQAPEPCLDNRGNVVPNCVKIGGQWIIGTGETPPPGLAVAVPPKGVKKIIVNFDFGPSHDFQIKDFGLSGPDGRQGEDDVNKGCSAVGKKGEDAFRVRISAGNITIDDFELWLGDGGRGGHAETIKNCEIGRATGGDGGKPGNLKIEAVKNLNIVGNFVIHPGYGGDGGRATAHGRDGINSCPGQKGGDATARGGNGSDNKKDLRALGSITGLAKVSISSTRGGHGGDAVADPGKGGNGTTCGCNGGKGGNGTAIGGKGGNANLVALGTAVNTKGGNGGSADSRGGLGGNGGMCSPEGPGGNGGNGGEASSTKGAPGTGKAGGDAGTIVKETGGNAGNGGDGCLEGQGGAGGNGNPDGSNGKPGRNLCAEPRPAPMPVPPATEPRPDQQSPQEPIPTEPPQNGGIQFYY